MFEKKKNNLQDELYQLENKQAKSIKLPANIRWELKDKICKIRQYLNYIY